MEFVIVQSYRSTLDSCMLSFCPRCVLSICSDARVSPCRPREQGLWSPLAAPCHQRYFTVNLYAICSPDHTWLISLWCGGVILNDFMGMEGEWFVPHAHDIRKGEPWTLLIVHITHCLSAAVLSWCFYPSNPRCCIVAPRKTFLLGTV